MARKHAKITDADAAELIRKRIDFHGQSARRKPFERMVLKNRAFFFGKQHFIQDEQTGRLKNPTNVPLHRVFYKANMILGNVLRSILTVTNAQGEFTVPPKDNTRQARHAAWVSTKLFEHLAYTQQMSEKEQVATLYAALDGCVIWKIAWDPDAGEMSRFYWGDDTGKVVMPDPDERMRAMLEEEGKYDDLAAGDVSAEAFPWAQCWWDWTARESGFDKAQWGATASVVSLDYIEETYGAKEASMVKPDEALDGSLYYDEAISFMASSFGAVQQYQDEEEAQGDRTVLVEYWERPRPQNGMLGRNLHFAGDHVLINRENKYRLTGYPIPLVKQDWIKAPGRFVGISLVEQLTSPQHQYNLARATIAEHQKVYGHPAMLVPKNSEIPTGHLTVSPGTVHTYNPTGGEIKFAPSPQLPKEVVQNAEMARAEMAEISSQQSLDGSKLPGQLRSGPALEAVFEERNKMLAHPAMNYVMAKERIGRQMLALAKKFYTEDRVISYIGEDRRFRALSFKRADLQTDLRVVIDRSKLISSPSAVRARVLEMIQLGAVDPMNNPDDREAVFKALEFGGVEEIISDRLQEEENQEREIDEIVMDPTKWMEPRFDMMAPAGEDGMPSQTQGYPTGEFDDHRAHMRVLTRFIRSEEFRRLDPISQSVILQHAKTHQGILREQEIQALMMQQALAGGAGQKGQPSKPKAMAPQ